ILIDQARRKHADKRGGTRRRVELDAAALLADSDESPTDDLLALDDALRQFEKEEPLKSRLVKLGHFAGVSIEQARRALGISNATAKRHWVYARTWLYGKLHGR